MNKILKHTFCENQSSGRPGFPNGLIALLTETLTKNKHIKAISYTLFSTTISVLLHMP